MNEINLECIIMQDPCCMLISIWCQKKMLKQGIGRLQQNECVVRIWDFF